MQEDYIIVLAWPEGLVASAGSWYDKLFAKNGKYRVGHSALVLVWFFFRVILIIRATWGFKWGASIVYGFSRQKI